MKEKVNSFYIRAITLITIAYTAYYFIWRLSTFNPDAIWLSWIFWLAELYGFITFLCFSFMTWKVVDPKINKAKFAYSIDVFVPTYGEPLDILHATMVGCNGIPYPHKTYILDDSGRKEVEELTLKLGCNYIARPTHEGAKAGNINYAFKKTSGDLIIVIDADFIPLPDILDNTMGFFDDPEVGIVQGPQIFYNLDSFQHEYSHWHEQELFYKVIQSGKNATKSAFWCGSPSVVRRKALELVGGVVEESVTEDIHTAIRMIGKGYHALYLNRPIAVGIAPATLEDFLGQRFRWAQGSMQVLRSKDNPIWAKGLTLAQRINYLASMTTYFDSVQKFIYLSLPVLSLATGLFPVSEFGLNFLYRFVPYMILGILANTVLGRGFYKFWLIELYNVIKMFTFIRAMGTLLTGKAQKFKVTNKETGGLDKSISLKLVFPQIFLLSITLIVGVFTILMFIYYPGFVKHTLNELIVLILWVLFTSSLMFLGISKLRKISKRSRYRFPVKESIYWRSKNEDGDADLQWKSGFSINFSTNGIGLELAEQGGEIGDLIELNIPFKRPGLDSISSKARSDILLEARIVGKNRLAEEEKYRVGTIINSFNADIDKSLYMEMLYQPNNLLKGEILGKKKLTAAIPITGELLDAENVGDLVVTMEAESEVILLAGQSDENAESQENKKKKIDRFIYSSYDFAITRSVEEKKLGILLVKKEIISEEMLKIALLLQKKTNYKIGKTLLLMGYITEENLAENLAEHFGIKYKKLLPEDLDMDVVQLFPKKLVLEYGLLPFNVENDKILVAISDLLSDECIKVIKKIYDKDIEVFMCANSRIIKIASKAYEDQEKIKIGLNFLKSLEKRDHERVCY